MSINPTPIHADWADSMANWAMTHQEVVQHRALEAERMNALTADYTPADRHEGIGWIELQGCREQGWPARRCSPEMCGDRLPEDYDQGERTGHHRPMGILARALLAWRRLL